MATIGETTRPGFVYDSATDTWIPVGIGPHAHTPAAIGAISNELVNAKGDLISATANDTPARLAVGTNNYFLRANSTESTGLEWAGAWTSFTPTYLNLTVGNGTNTGKYLRIGNIVFVMTSFVFGSTSSMTGSPLRHYFPFTSATTNNSLIGNAYLLDSGTMDYPGAIVQAGNDNVVIYSIDASTTYSRMGGISTTVPFTWATNDAIRLDYFYEV
jgi:hypothetical protein